MYDFFIRNKTGDFIYAQAEKIGITMNIEAENGCLEFGRGMFVQET